jgi:hypothetical protein
VTPVVDGGKVRSVAGPWTVVANEAADRVGGIHHDQTARERGFAAGIVGGDVLLALTVDAAKTVHPDWYRGTWFSHAFVAPAYDGDELRVTIDDGTYTLERRDGTVIGVMRAGTGAPERAPLAQGGDPLPHEPVGSAYDDETVVLDEERWTDGDAVSTVGIFHLAHFIRPTPVPEPLRAELRAGMNSRFEGEHLAPMLIGRPYLRRASLLAKSIKGRYGARTVAFSFEEPDTGVVVFRGRWGVKWVRASST